MINHINHYVGDVIQSSTGEFTFVESITLTEIKEFDNTFLQLDLSSRETIFKFLPRYDKYAGELCRNCKLGDIYSEEDCKRFCKFFRNPSFPEYKIYLPGDEVFHIPTRTTQIIKGVRLYSRTTINRPWVSNSLLGVERMTPLLIFSESHCADPEDVRIRKRNSILSLHHKDVLGLDSEICSGCIYNDGWCFDCPIEKLKSR